LIYTWLAFAWVGLPLLFGIILLDKAIENASPLLQVAKTAGVIGAITQMVGLLRWVFVVPVIAATYTNPTSSEAAKEAALVAFQVVHQYGGVVLGEHLGQAFTILWMALVSAAMFKSNFFKPWLGWFGVAASAVYILAVPNGMDFTSRLQCGQVWQRIHLWATTQGLAMQPLNQMTERADREVQLGIEPVFGNAIAELIGDENWMGIMPFRMGYPTEAGLPSPRRGLDKVIG